MFVLSTNKDWGWQGQVATEVVLLGFFIENTVQHTVRHSRRSHPVPAPAHSYTSCWIRATRKSFAEMEEEKGKKYRINTMHLALFQEPVLVPQGSQPFPKAHRAQLVSGHATTSAKLWAFKCQTSHQLLEAQMQN